ncbi:DNA mismatch repair protein msh6, partial [Kappamyces sp. JEL0680]
QQEDFRSERLKQLASEGYPDELVESLHYFSEAFDHQDALATGKIQLHEGYDNVFDENRQKVADIEARLETYRKDCEKSIGAKIAYRDIGKEIYQLEIPSKVKTPREWVVMSKTQAVNRYYSEKLRAIINELLEAKEICEASMRNIKGRLYETFDEHYHKWMKVINNLAEIDCLMGLALCRRNMNEPICRPEFVDQEDSLLELEELRHPCVLESITSEYIPNDLALSNKKDSMVLLTGPNMGGKSTLLRQTCIAVIMAQIGCYIPAAKCRLTPFDRIFTRIGANDNIMAGQSTFMVELSETSKILKEATSRSLVILDELGRGTSTFDGY